MCVCVEDCTQVHKVSVVTVRLKRCWFVEYRENCLVVKKGISKMINCGKQDLTQFNIQY